MNTELLAIVIAVLVVVLAIDVVLLFALLTRLV